MNIITTMYRTARQIIWTGFVIVTLSILIPFAVISQSHTKREETASIDSAYFPIEDGTLQSALSSAISNPVETYELLRRAGMQKKEVIALNEMSLLKQANPKNAVVLAGYCMAYDIARGDYQINARHATLPYSEQGQDEYPKILNAARTMSPHLWMIYAVEGMHFQSEAGPQNSLLKSSFDDFQKAVRYGGNVSYTHSLLADGYIISYQQTTAFEYSRCAQEAETAIQLKPVIADPAWTLFLTYASWLPNRGKALEAKRLFYSRIPRNTTLSKEAQQALDQYLN